MRIYKQNSILATFALLSLIFKLSIVYSQPTSNVAAYYPLNGNAYDVSSNSKHGTVTETTFNNDRFGNINGIITFDGINDKVSLPNNLLISNTEFAFSLWLQIKGSNNDLTYTQQTIFDLRGQYNTWLAYVESTDANHPNSIYFYIYSSASNYGQIFSANNSIALNEWYHIVCTYSNNKMDLYLNGALVSSVLSKLPPAAQSSPDYTNSIGKDYWTKADRCWLNGSIDDLLVYQQGLSSSEVLSIYNRGILSSGLPELYSPIKFNYDVSGNRTSKNLIKLKSGSNLNIFSDSTNYDLNELSKDYPTEYFEEDLGEEKIIIYPNPTNGYLKINIEGAVISQTSAIYLYSISGSLIQALKPISVENDIDLTKSPNGTYVLKVFLNNKLSEWKIIKE